MSEDQTMSETKNDSTEFTPIDSQDQLDAILRKRLKDQKDLQARLVAKDQEIATLKREMSRTRAEHAVDSELLKRGITDTARAARIKKMLDLSGDSETEPAEQLEALSKDVPELFKVPRGAGSGGSKKPVLEPEEKPLTEEEIRAMSPEEMAKPSVMARVDAFLKGQRD